MENMLGTLIGVGALYLFWKLVRPAIDSRRWKVAADLSPQGLALAGLSVLALWTIFRIQDPIILASILVMVMVHEYGHVLAYRLAGHRDPVFRLIPFGGVASSGEGYSNHAESSFVAMMGPGFSIGYVALLALTFHWAPQGMVKAYLYQALYWTAFLNVINMVPVYPLDGGHALRSILSFLDDRIVFPIMYGMSGLLTLFAIWLVTLGFRPFILLFVVFAGVMALQQEQQMGNRMRRLTFGESGWVALTFLVIVLTYLAFLLGGLLIW